MTAYRYRGYTYSRARYRRHFYRRSNDGMKLAIAGAIALAMVGAGAPVASHAVAAAIRGGSAYTPQTWAVALLRDDHLPQTPCDVSALTAWEGTEGGNWQNSANGNPLNTTMPEPGSSAINSVGVQSYPSWQEGFAATVATLNNGDYPGILAALRAGNSAQAVTAAVSASVWGTRPFTASC